MYLQSSGRVKAVVGGGWGVGSSPPPRRDPVASASCAQGLVCVHWVPGPIGLSLSLSLALHLHLDLDFMQTAGFRADPTLCKQPH